MTTRVYIYIYMHPDADQQCLCINQSINQIGGDRDILLWYLFTKQESNVNVVIILDLANALIASRVTWSSVLLRKNSTSS